MIGRHVVARGSPARRKNIDIVLKEALFEAIQK